MTRTKPLRKCIICQKDIYRGGRNKGNYRENIKLIKRANHSVTCSAPCAAAYVRICRKIGGLKR